MDSVFIELEEQRYGRNKDTLVDHSYILSGAYRRKFDQITTDPGINRLLYSTAKKILFHRSGTVFEDMYWIDAETAAVVASITDSVVEHGIKYTDRIQHVIDRYDTLITIHSHPNSMPPSYNDLKCNYVYGYQLGVVVCHNGKIYIYAVAEDIPENYYKLAAGDYINKGCNEVNAFLQVLTDLNKTGTILFKEVTTDNAIRR